MERHPSLNGQYEEGDAPLGGRLEMVGALSWADQINAASSVLERLSSLGIVPPAGNRLQNAIITLRRINRLNVQFGPSDPSTEEFVAEASRTIVEMKFIVETLQGIGGTIEDCLITMLGGPPVPVAQRHDRARDMQAELLTAAAMVAGGYVVQFAEPDLVITGMGDMPLGVAIKRVTSDNPNQYQKRLRAARDQLKQNGLNGLIVVNATHFLSAIYFADRSVDVSAVLYREVTQWLDYIHRNDENLNVRGVIGIGTSLRYDVHTRSFNGRLHFNPRFLVADEAESLAIDEHLQKVSELMQKGMADALTGRT